MGRTGITGLRFYIMWLNSDSTLYSAKAQTSGESEFLFVCVHNKAFRCFRKALFFAIKELITSPKEGKYNTVRVGVGVRVRIRIVRHNLLFPLEKGGGFMDAGPEQSSKTFPCQDTIHKITLLLEG